MRLTIGTRVQVKTSTGGCYHGKTGSISRILNGNMTPLDMIPDGSLNKFPYWYSVTFDEPADNGGTPVEREIFLQSELFPEDEHAAESNTRRNPDGNRKKQEKRETPEA